MAVQYQELLAPVEWALKPFFFTRKI